MEDISTLKLRQGNNRFLHVAKLSSEGIVVTDHEGIFTFYNDTIGIIFAAQTI